MANVRIIDQPLITTLSGDEYLVTDSSTAGTKKITPQNLVNACSTGTGVSDDLKVALLQIAEKVAYIDDDGQQYYDDLYAALYDTTWAVSNTLTHCSSSNAATSVTKNGSYSATITASAGYTLTGATVSITMGGSDITASAYNNGTISIASVTGALVISVSAAAKTVSSISAVYTQSGTVYDTDSLNSLKADLVVTATYSDTTTATIPSTDYTLSGTLEEGTSVITVTYETKTTTFSVTVSSLSVESISAVYTQSGTVYDTDSLDSLKSDLVVTATLSDSSEITVPSTDYTLSGTLTAGTSTITVSYSGQTTTFTVSVTADTRTLLYNWDLTTSLTDTVENVSAVLNGSGTTPTLSSSGLTFDAATQNIYFGSYNLTGKTIEVDVASFSFAGNSSKHIRFIMMSNSTANTASGYGPLIFRSGTGWSGYVLTASSGSSSRGWYSTPWISGTSSSVVNSFDGKTVKIKCETDGYTASLYVDNTLIGTRTSGYYSNSNFRHFFIGGINTLSQADGDQCFNMTITGVRIYSN